MPMNGAMESPMHGSYPPSFTTNADQMPEIKDWEVGQKYKMVVEVEMKGMNEDKDMITGNFDVLAYKYLPEKDIADMNDKEFGDYQDEKMAMH